MDAEHERVIGRLREVQAAIAERRVTRLPLRKPLDIRDGAILVIELDGSRITIATAGGPTSVVVDAPLGAVVSRETLDKIE